jgi:hypothetical protein
LFCFFSEDLVQNHSGLNNNNISTKLEPLLDNDDSPSPRSSPHQSSYPPHTSPGSSSMHFGENSSSNTKEDVVKIMTADDQDLQAKEQQAQAEDLSNKSNSNKSESNGPSHLNVNNHRFHPYCHTEVMIKSE